MGNASYTLRNFGRAPAIIREIYDACVISRELPKPIGFPPLQTCLMKVELVGVGEASELHEPPNSVPLPSVEAAATSIITPKAETAFIIGQVRYADVFGNQYISGFCYALNEHTRKFYAIGGAAHSYRRKLNEAETREAEARDTLPQRQTN